MKGMKKTAGAFSSIVIVAIIVVAGFYMLNRQAQINAQESKLPTTEVEKILAKDLDTKYPETPTEVVKFFWRINSCMYNKNVSDKEFDSLLKQLRKLYDNEFLSLSANSFEKMSKSLKKDIEDKKDDSITFSAYVVQSNSTIREVEMDGSNYASVISSVLLKSKGQASKSYEKFACRRNNDGDWKILGWKKAELSEAEDAEVE